MLSRRSFIGSLCALLFSGAPLFAVSVNGIDYISIAEAAKFANMKYRTLVRGKKMSLFNKYSNITFEVNSRVAKVNGYFVNLGHPVAISRGMLLLSKRDLHKTLYPILFPRLLKNPRSPFHIVIDAGHGGKDTGAQNKRYRIDEKDINLSVAIRLGQELAKMGYKVSYTRTKDVAIDLEHRPIIANRRNADLFVSIHTNATRSSIVSGVETYALTPEWLPSSSSSKLTKADTVKYPGNNVDGWSQLLSFNIQKTLVDSLKADDRGARRARFAVLRTANMPACLVEVGFISNSNECLKLASSAYRQQIAIAIAQGIAKYANVVRQYKR